MRESPHGALSRLSMGRLLGALFALGSVVALYSLLLPPPPSSLPLVVADGVLALVVGALGWLLPWGRWPQWAPLPLLVCAFPMIALYNHLAGEPLRYPVFFLLAFVWVGLAQPRGVSLALAPLFVVAYLLPLVTNGSLDHTSAASILFVGPVAIVMGEVLAWISADLRSAQRTLYDQLEHSALHDSLTQLANRALFRDRVAHAAALAARRGQSIDVLFIDLDDFKTVNDGLGHGAGDELLRIVGQRLLGCLRSSDTVARLGGDEFAVLLEPTLEPTDPEQVADRVQDALRPPIRIGGRSVSVSASIGIARGGDGADGVEGLLRNADMAMYRAKADGKRRHRTFEPSMRELADRELQLRGALPGALERGELVLHYQPIVELTSLEIVGLEALTRWHHPEFGTIAPDDFIPLADEIGLGDQLRDWVLRTGCAQLREWDRIRPSRGLTLSVNVSARQLQQSGLAAEIGEVLATESFAAERVMVEITERELFDNLDMGLRSLRALRELGVRIALDDFGLGYSSLSYLHQLPVDTLKIDRSFVASLGGSTAASRLADAVVRLGTSLGFDLVAEGIEQPCQLAQLRRLNCRLGQGYLLGRPMAPAALGALIRRRRIEPDWDTDRGSVASPHAKRRTQPAV